MKGSPSDINLQATLAAASPTDEIPSPHHPINCRDSLLWLEEDGRFGCDHVQVPADDPRTQACIDHSVAILLIELMVERESR
jgi:hypothetical protein